MAGAQPALELVNIARSFGTGEARLDIFSGLSLSVYPGEIVALVGQSGSGKSSLLHIAGLLEKPTAGEVLIAGQRCVGLDDQSRTRIRRIGIGFVYQFHHLLPEFSALENVVMPQLIAGASKPDAMKRARDLLDRMGLASRMEHRPAELSGGEQQRVAIARAIANRPLLLLADEPTGNLDPGTALHVQDELMRLIREEGLAALVATHNLELAAGMSRIARLANGHIAEGLVMKAIFAAAQLAHAPKNFLSQGNVVSYPEAPERARRLLEGARQAGAEIHAARRFGSDKLVKLHTKSYVDFLETGFSHWKAIPGAGADMMVSLRPMVAPAFQSTHIVARAGRHLMDFSCALTEHSWKSIQASAWTALTAADFVLKGDPVAYALCRPPGHHAYVNRASGFCYLNNSGLAAQHLRTTHERVAILDIDVHHGNGTQALFYGRPDVLTVSIHADPAEYYPFYWGSAAETGEGEGIGFNLNLPVPVRSGDSVWMAALETALERILEYDPGGLWWRWGSMPTRPIR